ncbi:MAG: sigma-70 family RNA polymerase sigma factor, partial [Planctomycetia bacterium]|nr:sigma-70 family RNA polymerase sigma factor [Planctomycetia bacterium]
LAERGTAGDCCDGAPWRDSSSCGEIEADRTTRLHAAIGRLEPRLRTVVELLLEGKSQAVIAHALDVCEGTVSRLRSRAVAELRRMTE